MLNWVKIRVWEQVQWDGIIMIDVDVTVLGDLMHLFKLPTDFAAVPDNGKVWNRYIRTLWTWISISGRKSLCTYTASQACMHAQSLCLQQASIVCLYHLWLCNFGIDRKGGRREVCVSSFARPCASFVSALYYVSLVHTKCGFQRYKVQSD